MRECIDCSSRLHLSLLHQKLAAFNYLTFRALIICSNTELFNCKISYTKTIDIDCGFCLKINNHDLFKPPTVTDSVAANIEINNIIVLPCLPTVSTQISHILNKSSFKVVFSPTNKL